MFESLNTGLCNNKTQMYGDIEIYGKYYLQVLMCKFVTCRDG